MSPHARGTMVCLLAFVAAGCSGSAPKSHITTTSEQRLVAQADPLPEGKIRLRIGREWTRELERAVFHGNGVKVAIGPASYVSDGTGGDPGSLMGALFALSAAVVLAPFVFLIEQLLSWSGIHPSRGATVHTSETVYDPTWQATIEPASGEFVLSLGSQPEGGYLLDAETVRQLGADVVVRDRELFVAIRLPAGK